MDYRWELKDSKWICYVGNYEVASLEQVEEDKYTRHLKGETPGQDWSGAWSLEKAKNLDSLFKPIALGKGSAAILLQRIRNFLVSAGVPLSELKA